MITAVVYVTDSHLNSAKVSIQPELVTAHALKLLAGVELRSQSTKQLLEPTYRNRDLDRLIGSAVMGGKIPCEDGYYHLGLRRLEYVQ